MADDADKDAVVAFLNHLLHHEREREHVEHVLLKEIVAIAAREGYEFSAEDFKTTVRVDIRYLQIDLKWPPGRK